MKIRFQADADLDEDIVTGLRRREPSLDFQSASEARLESLHDREVLARAASQGRILVSHDRKTMPRHFAEFILEDTSAGLLIVSQRTATVVVIDDLLLIWNASEAEEWANRIAVLPL